MRSLRSSVLALGAALALLTGATTAAAAEEPANEAPEVVAAREEFVRGTELAKKTQWAEALVAFERSAKLRPHAVTTYNIGVCHRAMGNYTLARETLARSLRGSELPDALARENEALLGEIDRLLATANVTLSPPNASVSVDGRPLAPHEGEDGVLVAGIRDPGPPEPAPGGAFKVRLNPGVHVFTVSRPGFADAVVNRSVTPGATIDLKLELDRLPATLRIAASEPGAVVTVNDLDVGVVPVDLSRPAGSYRVVVKKQGFEHYESTVALQPGQKIDLRAPLAKEQTAITKRWWFWTAAGTLLVGAVAGTYALTRGETTRQEPLDGGGLGWAVKLQ